MKKIFFYGVIGISISLIYMENSIYTIYMLLYMLTPILLLLLLNYKNCTNVAERIKFVRQLTFLYDAIINVTLIIGSVFLFIYMIENSYSEDELTTIFHNTLYYVFIILEFIFVNFYSTRKILFRNDIEKFLNKLVIFFKNNYILNLFVIIFAIIIRHNENLLFGILGSYLFFFLTELNKFNEDIKNDVQQLYGKILLIIMNIGLMYYLVNFEKIFLCIQNSTNLDMTGAFYLKLLIPMVLIVSNYYEDTIKKVLYIMQKYFIMFVEKLKL